MLRATDPKFLAPAARGFRDACEVDHSSTAYVTVIATVSGALIGFAGTAFASWQQEKRAQRAAQVKAIGESLTAADDLLAAVRIYRAGGGALFQYAGLGTGLNVGLTGLRALLPADTKLSVRDKLLLTGADIARAIAPGGVAINALDKTAARYLAIVQTPRQRLSAVAAPLRLAKSTGLAAAADRLTRAGGNLADNASSSSRKYSRAERAFEKAVRDFQGAVPQQRGLWPRPSRK